MNRLVKLLNTFLETIVDVEGLLGAALYLPDIFVDQGRGMLAMAGARAPAELSSRSAAEETWNVLTARTTQQWLPSGDPGCYLLPIQDPESAPLDDSHRPVAILGIVARAKENAPDDIEAPPVRQTLVLLLAQLVRNITEQVLEDQARTPPASRNVDLLWEVLSFLSNPQLREHEVPFAWVQSLCVSFEPDRVALVDTAQADAWRLLAAAERLPPPEAGHRVADTMPLHAESQKRARDLITTGQSVLEESPPPGSGLLRCMVPVRVGVDTSLLYIEGHAERMTLEEADVRFLAAMTTQVILATQRLRLQEEQERAHREELKTLRSAVSHSQLTYGSPQLEEVVAAAQHVAPTDVNVLIIGESGTGKELLAKTIHSLSTRADKPFVVVDCSAISFALIESELFGHERGAYTGAHTKRAGRLEEADGGTVFLDEIGELPLDVQGKLLRFVQEKTIVPVGGTRGKRTNIRIVAATNRDLAAEMELGRFRQDLFFRLNVITLLIPPLRERPDDITLLADHFLRLYAAQFQRPVQRFSPEAMQAIATYGWPGNVRELQNCVMRAVIMSSATTLEARDLHLGEKKREAPVDAPAGTPWTSLLTTMKQEVLSLLSAPERVWPVHTWLEEDMLLAAFEFAGKQHKGAARCLGLAESTFRGRLKRIRSQAEGGLLTRPDGWQRVRNRIRECVTHDGQSDTLLLRMREAMLLLLRSECGGDSGRAAGIMGVSAPTYRRWQALIDREGAL